MSKEIKLPPLVPGTQEQNDLWDHVYEYTHTSEGVHERLEKVCRAYALQAIEADRAERQGEAVAYVDGDEAHRRILWEPNQAAFNLPVGTKLYTHPSPPEGMAVEPVAIRPDIQAVLAMLDVPVIAHMSSHEGKLLKPGQEPPAFESAVPLVREWDHRRACETIIAALSGNN